MLIPQQTPVLQQINESFLAEREVILYLKREDLIHPLVSGNKWRKLKYNLLEAKKSDYSKILTFGGAYSNHIHATAAAANYEGFESIGIIRREENLPLNETLQFATDQGMKLHYVSRSEYRNKTESDFLENLKNRFGDFYHIPEGGSNALAVEGCMEIKESIDQNYQVICSPVGTGGTLAGLIASHDQTVDILGFSALKGEGFLDQEVNNLLSSRTIKSKWKINYDYHFGGYAKIKPELIEFINVFHSKHEIALDPIYTGKMMFGLYDLISKGDFEKGTTIIALHTGGLQGIKGIEGRYHIKLPK